jgi:hypothetical protein
VNKTIITGLALGAAIFVSSLAFAAATTKTVTANVKFLTPLSITLNNAANFGILSTGTATSYSVNTYGFLSKTGGANGTGTIIDSSSQAAASLTIIGSSAQTIKIDAVNAQPGNGVVASNFKCRYDIGSAADCSTLVSMAAPSTGTPLFVGLTITTTGAETDGATAAPSFDIAVTYN